MTLNSRLVNLAATAHKLVELGMMRGVSPSVSLRWEDVCYLSPAGARMDRLSVADFISLKIDGVNTWQLQRVSSSYAIHLACYRARARCRHGPMPSAAPLHCTRLRRLVDPGHHSRLLPGIRRRDTASSLPRIGHPRAGRRHRSADRHTRGGIAAKPGPGARCRQHGRGLCQESARRGSRPILFCLPTPRPAPAPP